MGDLCFVSSSPASCFFLLFFNTLLGASANGQAVAGHLLYWSSGFFRMGSSVGLGSDNNRFYGTRVLFLGICISRHHRIVWGIVLSYYRAIILSFI